MPKTLADWNKLWTTAGGRRFVLALGAGCTTTILQWFGKLDAAGTTYAMVVIATVGSFITGNTIEAIKTRQNNETQN